MANLLSIKKMHDLIEQDTQKFGFYVYDDFDSEQIDLQINRQIYAIIDGILDKFKGRIPKLGIEEGFQIDQVTLDNLRYQHVKDQSVTITPIPNKGISFPLPSDYYHLVKGIVTISYDCKEDGKTVTKTFDVKIRESESSNIDVMKDHPFFKTNKKSPLAELAGNTVYVYTDSTFTITAAKIDYIKRPATVVYGKTSGVFDPGISTNCDLDDSLHYMVVDMTSIKIMQIIETPQQKIQNLKEETI